MATSSTAAGVHPGVITAALKERLLALWERTGDGDLCRLAEDELPCASPDDRVDWVSTVLMNCFKHTGDPQVFALLFELNRASFEQTVQARIRRAGVHVDAQDVLQEVFLNIYRYPNRFVAEKADSFRNWGHRIVRNTLLKFLKGHNRLARVASLDEEAVEREDARTRSPFRTAVESESAVIVDRAYLLYLNLYLLHFGNLSAKEQRALTMVEVENASYKDAAAELGIRLENLKMVIFRGRRKIFKGMTRTLQELDSCHPPTSN